MFFFRFMYYYAITVAAGFGLEVLLRNEWKTVYDGRQFNFSFNRIGVVCLVRNYMKKLFVTDSKTG